MEVWGLILNGVGAILVAYGQYQVGETVRLWLMSLQVMAESREEIQVAVVRGVDRHWARSAKLNRWLAVVGWSLFVTGIALQLVPHVQPIK
jgi:hypothetical protein